MRALEFIHKLLGYVFPERPDYMLVTQTAKEQVRALYAPTYVHEVLALTSFEEPCIRACVHELKYHENERAADLLAVPLTHYLHTLSASHILIPIPLARPREKKRGFNQVMWILKRAAHGTKHDIADTLLVRTRDTISQTSLSRQERLSNVVGAFSIHPGNHESVVNRPVIIIDDVVTTGATLKEGRAALAPLSPSSITLLALSH